MHRVWKNEDISNPNFDVSRSVSYIIANDVFAEIRFHESVFIVFDPVSLPGTHFVEHSPLDGRFTARGQQWI